MFRLNQFSSTTVPGATSSSSSSTTTTASSTLDHTFDNIFSNMLLSSAAADSSFILPQQHDTTSNRIASSTTNTNSSSSDKSNTHQQKQSSENEFSSSSSTSLIEIGKYAVWSVSTAKQGNGIEELRDDNLETYWQSDGPQPHTINIQFHKVLTIQQVAIYLDYKKDESYTPQVISIKCGSNFHDLTQIKTVELEEPVGYVNINMLNNSSEKDLMEHCRCNMLQIVISQNHQNGRDTHVRQVKVFGPVERLDHTSNYINPIDLSLNNSNASNQFDTLQFSMFSTLR